MTQNAYIAYCSPSGTTRHTAGVIQDALAGASVEVFSLDLTLSENRSRCREMIRTAGKRDCLFVGSPVYRDVAVPPVMDLIESLPAVEGVWAAPFVTWGAVTSGVALWQMGGALQKKGFALAGAAAVVAQHCMMWRSNTPAGAGRPDAEDDRMVRRWARSLSDGLQNGGAEKLALEALDYHARVLAAEMKEKIGEPWQVVPKTVHEALCTQCGVCVEACPVGAVSLDPAPVFDDACFDCFNCVRLCPEAAIDSPLSAEMIEEHIDRLKEKYGEAPRTRVLPEG